MFVQLLRAWKFVLQTYEIHFQLWLTRIRCDLRLLSSKFMNSIIVSNKPNIIIINTAFIIFEYIFFSLYIRYLLQSIT